MSIPTSAPDPMASQMAKLLTRSDADELREIIERWLAQAPTPRIRKQYEVFGNKLLELKQALEEQGAEPSEEELELALTMMMKMAAQHGGQMPPG